MSDFIPIPYEREWTDEEREAFYAQEPKANPILIQRKAKAFDWLSAFALSTSVGNGLAIFPVTIEGKSKFSLQDLGDEDGSNLGDELEVKETLLEAVEAAAAAREALKTEEN